MVLNPNKIFFEEKLLKGVEGQAEFSPQKQIQQAGIDIRMAKVFTIHTPILEISETQKPDFKSVYRQLEPDSQGWFHLFPGQAYSVDSMEEVELPQNRAAIVLHRSSFNRSGIFITGSVYDPGFKGNVGVTMYVFNRAKVQIGTRIAQIVFMDADGASEYKGSYQNQEGHK